MKTRALFLGIIISCLSGFVLAQKSEITLEDIWKNGTFSPRGVQGFIPMQTDAAYTMISVEGIVKYNFATGEKEEVLLANDTLKKLSQGKLNMSQIQSYSFDKEEKQILLATELESIYRRSTKAYYYLYDCEKNTLIALGDISLSKQSFATFSNDGNKIAFVRDNNIFIYDKTVNGEMQVTYDGMDNVIKNGIADWVYEEELSLSKCFEWSPDGSKLAFMRFDESHVKQYTMTYYGDLYPSLYSFKYPKAGEENSLVNVQIFDVESQKKVELNLGDGRNNYLPKMYWLPNSQELVVLRLNRHQNRLDFIRYNTETKTQDVIFTDHDDFWLDVPYCYFPENGKSMFFTSERDGYNHIYKYDFGGKLTQITSGSWEVAEVCAIDELSNTIYYLSNESNVLNRELYRVDFRGKKKKKLSTGEGWNMVKFNPAVHYYLNTYSDSNTPFIYSICDNNGKQIRILEDNAMLKSRFTEHGFVQKEFFSFTTDKGVELNGWMMKPEQMDPHKRYPVLMYVYGGPGSREVTNSLSKNTDVAWYQMLVQKGYIVVSVDGRGTGGRGAAFKKSIYKQMGKCESDDQISTANYLKTLPFVDADRIGIWGWSFGGYLSSLSLFKGDGTFKMAMAVAPVTSWRYYDNIYTERFLRTPQENPGGYDDNSPITHASKMQGAYLLIHGTTDDNVHFQNAMDLSTALISSEKQFEQFFYPNMNHFINAGTARYHLYTKMTHFILNNL